MLHRNLADRMKTFVRSAAVLQSFSSRTVLTILSLLCAPLNTPSQVHVLLNAYMRSGSYFTAKLLTDEPDTFPYMEPLWRLSVFGYFTNESKLCNTVWPSCRTAVAGLRKAYRILKNIYNCHLDKIKSLIGAQIRHSIPLKAAEVWRIYGRCNVTRSSCLSSLIQNCTGSRIRVTKVVRMSLSAIRPLLETDKYLKIFQLVRDPRGIICSRLFKTNWYPLKLLPRNYTPVIVNARALCKRMAEDYAAWKQLIKTYPNRVKFLRYDDLTYKFSQDVWDNVTRFLGVPGRTIRNDYANTRIHWRNLLNRDVLDIVDQECSYVYKVLGYIPLPYDELGNESLLSFIPYFEIG